MTPRYRLRTLLIVLALLPPLLWVGWGKYQAWKAEQIRQQDLIELAAQEAAAQAETQAFRAALKARLDAADAAAADFKALSAELDSNLEQSKAQIEHIRKGVEALERDTPKSLPPPPRPN